MYWSVINPFSSSSFMPPIPDNKFFSFEIVDGSLEDSRAKEQTLLLSSSMAIKDFGTNQSRGKEIKIYTLGDTLLFTIAAVYKAITEFSRRIPRLYQV